MNDYDDAGSMDEDTVKNLMALRQYLEKRIHGLEDEVKNLKTLFKILDEAIVAKSFRPAEAPKTPVETIAPPEEVREVPLKTSLGTLLATMYVGEVELRIVPKEGLEFNIETPPFQSFLINRVLEPMHNSDVEASERGEVTPDNILSYEVLREGDIIREIRVRNYGSSKRIRELNSTSRWTLEKMYEKTHQPD